MFMLTLTWAENAVLPPKKWPSRRSFLRLVKGLVVALAADTAYRPARAAETPEASGQAAIESFSASGKSTGLVRLPKIAKTDAEWLKQLTLQQFAITRLAHTEKPFSGAYWDDHDDGIYHCVCCDTALFDSSTKFSSHTGWPSFYEPISSYNVVKSADNRFGMHRTAVSCALCDAHLGHVFDDGPPPTGLRYCIDSLALRFVKRSA
ncbi:MAG TPA: peptide-methionine (R)-S-oxide reductase MsrB [Rhizomicrobium sp.]